MNKPVKQPIPICVGDCGWIRGNTYCLPDAELLGPWLAGFKSHSERPLNILFSEYCYFPATLVVFSQAHTWLAICCCNSFLPGEG